jgi:WD40 repeat protein
MKRRYIILSILLLFIFGIILFTFFYFTFFKKVKKEEIKFYTVKKIFNEVILYPEIHDNEIYCLMPEKNTYNKLTLKNSEYQAEILASDLKNIQNIDLSLNAHSILYQDENGFYRVYNFETKTKKELDKSLTGVAWYPLDSEETVIGSYSNPPQNNINLYKWRTGERKELLNLFVEVSQFGEMSPDGQKFTYFIEKLDIGGAAFGEPILAEGPEPISNFIVYNLLTQSEIINRGYILDSKFNIDSTKLLLLNQTEGQFPLFSLFNLESKQETPLRLQTYFNKISFTNDPDVIVYARVEDFQGVRTRDTLWKQHLISGKKVQLTKFDSTQPIDATDLVVSLDNQKIYFINQYDGKLYVAERE